MTQFQFRQFPPEFISFVLFLSFPGEEIKRRDSSGEVDEVGGKKMRRQAKKTVMNKCHVLNTERESEARLSFALQLKSYKYIPLSLCLIVGCEVIKEFGIHFHESF